MDIICNVQYVLEWSNGEGNEDSGKPYHFCLLGFFIKQ